MIMTSRFSGPMGDLTIVLQSIFLSSNTTATAIPLFSQRQLLYPLSQLSILTTPRSSKSTLALINGHDSILQDLGVMIRNG